jgi:YggT family protein
LQLALLVRVVTSWIGGTYSRVGRLAARMTDWLLRPIQRLVPPLGGVMDVSPILAYVAIALVAGLLVR